MHKTCTACSVTKHISEFHRNRTRKDGLTSQCKACNIDRVMKWEHGNPEKRRAARVIYRAKHREARRLASRERYRTNPQRYVVWAATRYQLRREEINRKQAEWAEQNSHIVAAAKARRRALKRKATPAWAKREAILAIYREAKRRSQETGERWTVDHIVPLKSPVVCGLHVEHNLQLLTLAQNASKLNRHWPDMPGGHHAGT